MGWAGSLGCHWTGKAYTIHSPWRNTPWVSTLRVAAPLSPLTHKPGPAPKYIHILCSKHAIPHSCISNELFNSSIRTYDQLDMHTSTKALNLLSNFAVMCRASEWKGELSPTKISVRHLSLFKPSVMSGLLKATQCKCKVAIANPREKRSNSDKVYYPLITCRNRNTFMLCLSSSNWSTKDLVEIRKVFETHLLKKQMLLVHVKNSNNQISVSVW